MGDTCEEREVGLLGGRGAGELLGVEGGREVLVGLRRLCRRHLEGEGTGGERHYSAHGGPQLVLSDELWETAHCGSGKKPDFYPRASVIKLPFTTP